MPPADMTPDFDKMTPEEIMAWMETLAKRQGVKSEELTTAADMQIAEIDPDTVVIDEPGYVPYGEERPPKPEPAAKPAAPPKPAAEPVAPPAPPARTGFASAPPPRTAPASDAPAQPRQPAAQQPPPPPAAPPAPPPAASGWQTPPAPEPAAATPESADLGWLADLGAETGGDLFNFDFSDLSDLGGAAAAAPVPPPAEPAPAPMANPMDWLSGLTASGGEAPPPPAPPAPPVPEPAPAPSLDEITDPIAAGVDLNVWLENLARRQGAKAEELTTDTVMNIPVPDNPVIDEPGYKPFSFDAPPDRRRLESVRASEPAAPAPPPAPQPVLDNPTDFLAQLANAEGVGKPPATLTIDEIERAIQAGTVTSEQMQYYLEHQADRMVDAMKAPEVEVPDEEAAPVPAELPDWLLEQVGAPPTAPAEMRSERQPPLVEDIVTPPAVSDMPDWLREDAAEQTGDLDFNIFVNETDEDSRAYKPQPVADEPPLQFQIEVDPDDPWVEAFDMEHDQGSADIASVPDWYARNLSDPRRIAAVEALANGEEDVALTDAALPTETELAAGEPEAMPDWLLDAAPAAAASAPVPPAAAEPELIAADVPDWLREVEPGIEPDAIPDWLMEQTEVEPSELPPVLPPAPAAPAPRQPVAPPQRQYTPAPLASGSLVEARQLAQSGDLAGSLAQYEALIRANADLDTVVSDVSRLAQSARDNPAVYRVLGDGLMRQGKLQAALDTYREALNHL